MILRQGLAPALIGVALGLAGVCADEIPGKPDEPVLDVVWRETFLPADPWSDRGVVDAGGVGGLLDSGAAGDEG